MKVWYNIFCCKLKIIKWADTRDGWYRILILVLIENPHVEIEYSVILLNG